LGEVVDGKSISEIELNEFRMSSASNEEFPSEAKVKKFQHGPTSIHDFIVKEDKEKHSSES
jgi:hypothetical protein